MARALLIVERVRGRCCLGPFVELLHHTLSPDNVATRPPLVAHRDGVSAVLYDAGEAAALEGESIRIGTFFGPGGDWRRPGGDRPEGCYALLRSDAAHAEIVADAAATRTVWYVQTPDLFVASTSQRAIVTVLGDYQPSVSAVTWMLSSGTLGPDAGWDRRLRRVLPGERVTLDRARWQLTHEVCPIRFEPASEGNVDFHERRLTAALEEISASCVFEPTKWAFLLSGGIDSRGLLALLRRRNDVRTITWGLSESAHQRLNDALIARRVAEALGVENKFFPTDLTNEPRECLIRRFLVVGEGRAASISPFIDGFEVWKTLREEGLHGAIRGDEAFGSRYVRNAYEARFATKLTMLTDYLSPAEIESLELPPQTLPSRLTMHQGETLATWTDRLYQQNRLPTFLAALTDLQSPYVEVTNPLLAGTVLRCVRTLPDALRTGKRLWRTLARRGSPNVPLARRVAVLPLQRFVSDTQMLEAMLVEMESGQRGDALSTALRKHVSLALRAALALRPAQRGHIKQPSLVSLLTPEHIRLAAHRWIGFTTDLEPLVFAFRAFIASRMNVMLKEDSTALAGRDRQPAVNL